MSPVESALQKLEGSVSGLEKALQLRGGEQPDMFAQSSAPSNQNATKQSAPVADAAIVEKKIDSAIGKVEALLRGA